jgi:hypothetical protein
MIMLSEYLLVLLATSASYLAYRKWNIRNLVPYPVVGAAYSLGKPIFGAIFLLSFLFSLAIGEIVFRKFLMYGMRVFHMQVVLSATFMLPYSIATSDPISLFLGMLSGQMAYDAHSSRDQVKTTILFMATFFLLYFLYFLARMFP